MLSRLTEFFEETNSLYKQCGFRKDFSTNHTTLNLLEDIQKVLDDTQIVYGFLLILKSI